MEQPPGNPLLLGRSNMVDIAKKLGNNTRGIPPGFSAYHRSDYDPLFSTSLPVLPHENLNFAELESGIRSIDDASSELNKLGKGIEDNTPIEDFDLRGIELPGDEDELLAGIMDDYDLTGMPSQLEELEECDLFGSGGGMELDFDPTESLTVGIAKTSITDGYLVNGTVQYNIPNDVGAVAGEHPFGEHPSRTLFVRNINSNVEDSELHSLFEQYGDIRALYTACKHRGFVMISYYDIRAARTAMRVLQNKPLRRRKLDIHFSIPKDNPSEKDINQGTLVVFNLEPSVSNDDLREIFGAYGEVKEIRETPHKRHHKFVEYYDVRAAEAALRALNRSDIAGKRIKLEPSRPGGARRNLMQQMTQDPEPDETTRIYRHQGTSPIINSPPGNWAHVVSPSDTSSFHAFSQSPNFKTGSPVACNQIAGLASILHPRMTNSVKIAPIGKDQSRINHVDQTFSSTTSTNGILFQHSHSFPEHASGIIGNMSSSPGPSFSPSPSGGPGIGTLSGSQFLWGSPAPYSDQNQSSAWAASPMGHSLIPNGQVQGFPYCNRPGSFVRSSQHHVGSAPSGIHFEKHLGYFPDSPDASLLSPYGSMGPIGRNDGGLVMDTSPRIPMNSGISASGSIPEIGSSGFRMTSSPRLGFYGTPYLGPVSSAIDGLIERGRSRRFDNNGGQFDSKKQYQLDLEKIVKGEDTRTTLMIKNIPNKYTSKMLLAAINEKNKGTFDFIYLPIDFKNKCNVGYAFINMVSPSHIIPFYEAFNGKKWDKFNSEKVASLAYARIQGLEALIAHFQNSSLMNEDKRCRPIIFHSEGLESADQEHLSLNGTPIHVGRQDGTLFDTSLEIPTNNCPDKKPESSLHGSAGEG